MEFWAKLLARAIVVAMSIAEAGTLRGRLFELKDEHEIMWTALDDIKRMHKGHSSSELASRTLEKIKKTYGR